MCFYSVVYNKSWQYWLVVDNRNVPLSAHDTKEQAEQFIKDHNLKRL